MTSRDRRKAESRFRFRGRKLGEKHMMIMIVSGVILDVMIGFLKKLSHQLEMWRQELQNHILIHIS